MYDLRTFFNERAAVWDKTAIYNERKIELMLDLSDIRQGGVLLDLACGTGVLEPYLLRYLPRRILAVDFAERMIEVARKKLSHPAVEFLCADLFDLRDTACDCCFLFNAFPHFPDPERLTAHVSTLIRPGGRLTISHTQGKHADADGSGILAPMLPAQGLINLLHGHYRLDVIVDNNVMLLISGTKLERGGAVPG